MNKIKLLIVDDSYFMINALKQIIENDNEIEVIGYASNGLDAINKIKDLKPDIITIDINMPYLDGIKSIKLIMEECPLPIIVLSAYTNNEESEKTVRALSAGAVDFLGKPDGEVSFSLNKYSDIILKKIKIAAKANVKNSSLSTLKYKAKDNNSVVKKIITIGVSTGGPSTLKKLFSLFKDDYDVTIIVVIHINEEFSSKLADLLNEVSVYQIKKGEENEILKNKTIYICGGDKNISIGTGLKLQFSEKYNQQTFVPSINYIFKNLSKIKRYDRMGIILTGMGKDGSEGIKTFFDSGGITVAQNQKSSIIYGMPGSAINTGKIMFTGDIRDIADYMEKFCENILLEGR